ncbi:MAG TPA: hypothetical protein VGG39_05205 [Polyangiaceae bacterium]|jgi:hypothetical protein
MTDPMLPRSFAEVMAILPHEDALAEVDELSDEQVHAELAALGYDADRMNAKAQDAVKRALVPAAPASPRVPVAAPARVISIESARPPTASPAKKAPVDGTFRFRFIEGTRWKQFSSAAMILLTLGTAGKIFAAGIMPATSVAYRTYVPPPSPEQRAKAARREAYAELKAGYYGEAWDALDTAKGLDEKGEDAPEVTQARKEIADYYAGKTPRHVNHFNNAKGPTNWRERPLQIHPR